MPVPVSDISAIAVQSHTGKWRAESRSYTNIVKLDLKQSTCKSIVYKGQTHASIVQTAYAYSIQKNHRASSSWILKGIVAETSTRLTV